MSDQLKPYRKMFAARFSHNGQTYTLIGGWSDLCAYYECTDGNVWTARPGSGSMERMTNNGPVDTFRANFSQRCRGELFA